MDGEPNPVFAVFEQLARMRGGRMRPLEPSLRHEVAGLIVDQGGEAGRHGGQPHGADRGERSSTGRRGELLDQLLGPYEVARIG